MKITNVEWNEGAPEKLEPGMLVFVEFEDEAFQYLIGEALFNGATEGDDCCAFSLQDVTRWAWLIKTQELAWLEDMANKHKARARG